MQSSSDVLGILALGSFWGAATLITVVALSSRYYSNKRQKQFGYNLAMQAFERGATAHEVERLLIAWHGNEAQAKDFMHELDATKKHKAADKAYASPAEVGY